MRAWQRLRRRILTPDVAQTKVAVRGFHVKNEQSRERLETVGSSFLTGFAAAAEATHPPEAAAALEATSAMYRGFAYEGAAMAFAIRDALPGRRRHHIARFLTDHDDHVYMAYVGVGWAMARLPRPLWSRLYAPDPLLRWLVLDGYGFHQAYFRTAHYVHQCHRERDFPWPGDRSRGYAGRAIDQGIGRASWFVAGTDPERLVRFLDAFAVDRRADLYAGAGLAAGYAGGATAEELRWLFDAAGPYRYALA
jgi:enediyne biosynthesis protein E3